jgi:hypothetical protein
MWWHNDPWFTACSGLPAQLPYEPCTASGNGVAVAQQRFRLYLRRAYGRRRKQKTTTLEASLIEDTSDTSGTATHPRGRLLRPGMLVLAGAVMVTGCATGGEDNWNSTAVGDDKSVGSTDLRSVLLVATDEGEPARLLGTFENDGDQPVNVTISDTDEETTLTLPAQGSLSLDTVDTRLGTAGDAPGARTTLTATTDLGEVELLVPVVDGTLDPYKPYLPD